LGQVITAEAISSKSGFARLAAPLPDKCDLCLSARIRFACNSEIYGKQYGAYPYIWLCDDCGSSVGCHKGTRNKLGRMCNRPVKKLRKAVHSLFDVIWKGKYTTRTKAYLWLADQLGITQGSCHVSWFYEEHCLMALKSLSQLHLNGIEYGLKKWYKKSIHTKTVRKQSAN